MDQKLLNEIIMKRKKKRGRMMLDKFSMDDDDDEIEEGEELEVEKQGATPGMDSEDLEEVDTVVMGDGVKEETIKKTSGRSGSTDDLSPSRQEQQMRGVDDGRRKKDEDIFNDDDYERIKRKGKPNGLYERMLMGLGKKLGK